MADQPDNAQEIWQGLAAPLNPSDIKTLQDGTRYITAWTVIERLQEVCPGDWEFNFEVLSIDDDTTSIDPQTGTVTGSRTAHVKGYLTINGLTRASVGIGDYKTNRRGTMFVFGGPFKQAQSDALKRCAVMFGFGLELYKKVGGERQYGEDDSPASASQRQPAPMTELPYATIYMTDLEGQHIAHIKKYMMASIPDIKAEKHMENRIKARFGSKINEIQLSVQEFYDTMAISSEEWKAATQ